MRLPPALRVCLGETPVMLQAASSCPRPLHLLSPPLCPELSPFSHFPGERRLQPSLAHLPGSVPVTTDPQHTHTPARTPPPPTDHTTHQHTHARTHTHTHSHRDHTTCIKAASVPLVWDPTASNFDPPTPPPMVTLVGHSPTSIKALANEPTRCVRRGCCPHPL